MHEAVGYLSSFPKNLLNNKKFWNNPRGHNLLDGGAPNY